MELQFWWLGIAISCVVCVVVMIILLFMSQNAKYMSQFGQDKRALEYLNFKQNGYYMEIGVHDGKNNNNTYVMDTKYGWDGICIDPFMANMDERSCKRVPVALGSKPGTMEFSGLGNGLGGLTKFSTSEKHNGMWTNKTKKFDVTTVDVETPMKVFEDNDVPQTIDFLSLDVEGAEMDVLKAFPFDKYCVRYAAIETNNDKTKESEMRKFMKQKGYKFEGHHYVDDFYSKTC